jgi:purine-binding chemotaxis protein CheW
MSSTHTPQSIRQLRDDPASLRTLEERAQVLARRAIADDLQRGEEILTFRLGGGRYGIAVRLVHEVQVLGGYTPLPGTPPLILGLVNLRGRLLTILDIRPLLGLSVERAHAGAALLIVGAAGIEVGLLADEVIEIRYGATTLAPSLGSADGQVAPWVHGVDSDLTVRLDLSLLLAEAQLIIGASEGQEGHRP